MLPQDLKTRLESTATTSPSLNASNARRRRRHDSDPAAAELQPEVVAAVPVLQRAWRSIRSVSPRPPANASIASRMAMRSAARRVMTSMVARFVGRTPKSRDAAGGAPPSNRGVVSETRQQRRSNAARCTSLRQRYGTGRLPQPLSTTLRRRQTMHRHDLVPRHREPTAAGPAHDALAPSTAKRQTGMRRFFSRNTGVPTSGHISASVVPSSTTAGPSPPCRATVPRPACPRAGVRAG